MPFLGIAGIFICAMSDNNCEKFLYQKAIDAYWNHVNRYHTWMNYYALFNGALFVGFCTLLTATTTIKADSASQWNLENNYTFLQFTVCIIGLVSSCAWLASISGHEKWEKNWMNIIESFETAPLYRLIVCGKDDFLLKKDYDNHEWNNETTKDGKVLEKGDKFKAYSTHTITKIFVWSIIIGWIICFCYSAYRYLKEDFSISKTIIIILISVIALVIALFVKCFLFSDRTYSNVEGKILKIKE